MTIAENNLMLFHIDTLDRALTQLSLRGYKVLKINAKNEDIAPSIELNRAYESAEVKSMDHNGRKIAFCDELDVRLFWSAV